MTPTGQVPAFAVAKLRHDPEAPGTLAVAFTTHSGAATGDDRVRSGELRSDGGAVEFLGRRTLTWEEHGGTPRPLELEITARGTLYDLVASIDGGVAARGLGIRDPEGDDAILVSWWTGERRPAGIVKYSISVDEGGVIDAVYTSVMSEVTGFNDVLRGRATGDTSGGFPGTYTILYQGANDTTFGPFDWEITARGEVLDLTWKQDGALVIRGFGFADPQSSRSIIVNYWGASE
jgi:hypothetical protein